MLDPVFPEEPADALQAEIGVYFRVHIHLLFLFILVIRYLGVSVCPVPYRFIFGTLLVFQGFEEAKSLRISGWLLMAALNKSSSDTGVISPVRFTPTPIRPAGVDSV